jgi:cilia- and flagella-associated protein 52
MTQTVKAQDPKPQKRWSGHDDKVTCLAVSSTGRLLASGQQGKNADIIVWNVATGRQVFRFQDHNVAVRKLAFSPDDRLLVSTGDAERDGYMIFWDISTGKIVSRIGQVCYSCRKLSTRTCARA